MEVDAIQNDKYRPVHKNIFREKKFLLDVSSNTNAIFSSWRRWGNQEEHICSICALTLIDPIRL